MKSTVLTFTLAMLFHGVTSVLAVVPDAGNIYYGLAKDFLGQPLTPESGAEVVLMRIENGQETVLARSSILDIRNGTSTVNYVLRPSLDDGLAARYASSASRAGDVVGIYVIHNGARFAIKSAANCVPISDAVPVVAQRGSVHHVDFRCIDDFDGDCIADSWEYYWYGTTEFNGTEDFDGDQRNGLTEFVNGTNPFEFHVPNQPQAPTPINLTIETVESGSVKVNWVEESGTNYRLQWSEDLVNFFDVPADRFVGGSAHEVNTMGLNRKFFRVIYWR